MSHLIVHHSETLQGTITVPGDKSISHRAIILGSIAQGITAVNNLLEGEDVLSTIDAMRALGVKIRKMENGKWRIEGKGIEALRPSRRVIYCGNSGTTLRLLTGLLSGLPFTSTLTGDASLNARPMGRVIEPLQKMGAAIRETRNKKGRFITIFGRPLKGGTFKLPVASAQLKSALLLAGLSTKEGVAITEPARSRDHGERMLRAFGASLKVQGLKVSLKPGCKLKGTRITVPGDFSSAAFFLVAGVTNPDPRSRVVVKNVGMNPTRTGALDLLKRMGGRVRVLRPRVICGEPVADLEARPSALRAFRFPGKFSGRRTPSLASLIDEVPILCIAAALAEGKTVIRGAEELRIKETDRIHAMAALLPRFGIRVTELKDGLEIFGTKRTSGATGKSYGDHRIAMSLAILGLRAGGKTVIEDTDCIATSFPNFAALLKKVGAKENMRMGAVSDNKFNK